MLLNTTINGITLPVEIAEEELANKGYVLAKDNACKDTALRESCLAWIIDHDICFEKEETREALLNSDDFRILKVNSVLDLDDESFIYHVFSGNLEDSIQELVNKMESEEHIYMISYELSRRVTMKQTVDFTVKAKDEADLIEKVDDLCLCDIEEFIDEDEWEQDWYDVDEPELEGWDSEETDVIGYNHLDI